MKLSLQKCPAVPLHLSLSPSWTILYSHVFLRSTSQKVTYHFRYLTLYKYITSLPFGYVSGDEPNIFSLLFYVPLLAVPYLQCSIAAVIQCTMTYLLQCPLSTGGSY